MTPTCVSQLRHNFPFPFGVKTDMALRRRSTCAGFVGKAYPAASQVGHPHAMRYTSVMLGSLYGQPFGSRYRYSSSWHGSSRSATRRGGATTNPTVWILLEAARAPTR